MASSFETPEPSSSVCDMEPLYVDCSNAAASSEEPLDLSLSGPNSAGITRRQSSHRLDFSHLLLMTAGPAPPSGHSARDSADAYPVCSTPSPSQYNQFIRAGQPHQGHSNSPDACDGGFVLAPYTYVPENVHWFHHHTSSMVHVLRRLTNGQQQFLFDHFIQNPYPSASMRLDLARTLHLPADAVRDWYRAQRSKFRARLNTPSEICVPESVVRALKAETRGARKRRHEASPPSTSSPPQLPDEMFSVHMDM